MAGQNPVEPDLEWNKYPMTMAYGAQFGVDRQLCHERLQHAASRLFEADSGGFGMMWRVVTDSGTTESHGYDYLIRPH